MRILICPMNWGLGHASRDACIVHKLRKLGHEVIMGGGGASLTMLQAEFPDLECIHLPGTIRITYFNHLPAWMKIFMLAPFLLYEILAEHVRFKKIIRTNRADLVISDNRYGLWSSAVKSILITHQCSIKFPGFARFLEFPASLVLKLFIEKFDACWIPDYPGTNNLSGDLSHRFTPPSNAVFIGPLSRFAESGTETTDFTPPGVLSRDELPEAKLLILLSGPEPQRTRLEKIIIKQLPSVPVTTIILQGLPGKGEATNIGPGKMIFPHLPSPLLKPLIEKASYIICRAGYTSVMDLVAMKKKAMIVPTPGQTEQEYLADVLARKGVFLISPQQKLDIPAAVSMLEDFNPIFPFADKDYLGSNLKDL